MKMATSSLWQDIDDKFCLCSICLEQFKEPKLLPCLHRFCKDCLTTLFKASIDTITCPECREEIDIPTNGVDGFKTDFYMRNLVEYVQIQQSLQSDETRECYSCLKHLKAAAYCFKCNNFICTDCYHAHMTNNTLKDHKQHTLSVTDIESKNISPEKLASMRDAPRCHVHPSKGSELYCETCNNVPVCVACMLGKHKGHDLHEVTDLASVKRHMLDEQLKALEKMKADRRKVMAPSTVKDLLVQNVTSERTKMLKMYDDDISKEKVVLEHMKRRQELLKDLKRNEKQKTFDSLQSEMEREILEVKKKYEDMFNLKETEIDAEFSPREKRLSNQITKSSQRLEELLRDKKESCESTQMKLNEKLQKIENMQMQLETENNRFENLRMMAANILASQNDWTAVQCIPDLCTAAANLMKDLEKEFPELERMVNVEINYQQPLFGKLSINKMLDQDDKKATVEAFGSYWTGATGSNDGHIVISGYILKRTAFIVVVDVNGTIIKRTEIKAWKIRPASFCDFISQHKVVLAYQPNTIGLYDICDGSYFEKVISNASRWPARRNVKCVATDPVNNHILVGGADSRDVYVFDDQLNYLHILTLPEKIKWPRDITTSDGQLLVCDYDGKKAYVVTMEGLESKVIREFIKPDVGADNLRPQRICKDKDGFVYMLWKHATISEQKYLVQYIHDGSHVLRARQVDDDANVVTTVETAEGEKVVVATRSRCALYLFGLIEEESGVTKTVPD